MWARREAHSATLQGLQDIIAILGIDELSEETSSRCRAPQSAEVPLAAFHVAEQFTGIPEHM